MHNRGFQLVQSRIKDETVSSIDICVNNHESNDYQRMDIQRDSIVQYNTHREIVLLARVGRNYIFFAGKRWSVINLLHFSVVSLTEFMQ